MPKATKQISTAQSCPVAPIARQVEALWQEHDRRQEAAKDNQCVCNWLSDATDSLTNLATFSRAKSTEGALFQVRLAFDVLTDIRSHVLTPQEIDERLEKIARLLYSIGSVLGSGVTPEQGAAGARYMPPYADPLLPFDRALQAA